MNKYRAKINVKKLNRLINKENSYVDLSNNMYENYNNDNHNGMFGIPDEVPYGSICGCNPANGGSGICGCINGNKMVPNPKIHGNSKINLTNTYTTNTSFTFNTDDKLFELFDYIQEEAKNKRLLANKSNDANYYYGMVSAFLDIQLKILKMR